MEIEQWDKEKKTLVFTVNGKRYKAKIIEYNPETGACELYLFSTNQTIVLQLTKKLEEQDDDTPKGKNYTANAILSPIAGRIIKVCVTENRAVKENQTLVIIESMKMENDIRAPFDLFVKSVPIAQGDLVKQNQELLYIQKNK